ncbi:uncharacterized protein LY79DRAFT_527273 [Colletotrichum navitas]|uniref:Uncharacterized protein n=1 Tax=Colletotrichum navitas TaxID=681940 RepID=A0AAD8PMN5_9PEZI|nr:uncharacterized protein LY79DRAFT_527273 [Colletotrichum navitas]KAK1570202.1 hypothetical protein LY79DRAFT_527273 [Colletotrichum navitas]
MRPRVVNALRWRYNKLGRENVWSIKDDQVVYTAWSRAFLSKAWDGVCFSRAYAETLLKGGDDDDNDDEDDDDDNDDDKCNDKGGQEKLVVRDEDEETVRPEDSISNIAMRRLPAIPEHEPGSLEDPSFEEMRRLMLRGAGNLIDFKWLITFQQHGVPVAGDTATRREAEELRERCLEELKVLERALDRAAARRAGIRQGDISSPVMGGIWGQLLGGLG